MKRNLLWLPASTLIVLSLMVAACGQAPVPSAPITPTTPAATAPPSAPAVPAAPVPDTPQQGAVKPSAEVPKYGGTLNIARSTDVTSFDPAVNTGQTVGVEGQDLVNEPLWMGDWAKGPAGGYGTNEISYATDNDLWSIKTGAIAESTKWTYDFAKNEGTIVYQIRQGLHWALDPKNDSSRLLNGREVTADDVIFNMKRMITDPVAYVYTAQREMRTANITKTGPQEITVSVTADALLTTITRFGQGKIEPPEILQKYGNIRDWKNAIGTGPFIRTDYVPGSQIVYSRNNNYWMTDPVGPGKGNRLPYLDAVRFLIIPDTSTRQAAFRTGKIDQMNFNFDDAAKTRKQLPNIKELSVPGLGAPSTPIRIDVAPFTDVRVRRALMMATDFQTIVTTLYPGPAPQIVTWPYSKTPGYEDMYLGLDDPEMPASVKELYTYNPDKAKQLLKDAGFPNGFKTSVLTTSTSVDYYSVLKDMWAKAGITLTIDVKDLATKDNTVLNKQHEALNGGGTGNPIAIWYAATVFSDAALQNSSQVHDPLINDTITKIRRTLLTDGSKPAMAMWKDMMKYVLDQAYVVPGVSNSTSRFWWPWVKNYSGEVGVSYYVFNYPQYVWYDQDLKKSMGY